MGLHVEKLIIDDFAIVELKAAESLCEEHEFQLINCLKATEIGVGLLLNFGKKPEFKPAYRTGGRKVFSNEKNRI